jgi:hypothetical protein
MNLGYKEINLKFRILEEFIEVFFVAVFKVFNVLL